MAKGAAMHRAWVRVPRLRSLEPDEGRRATWLELFYDLVYVAAVAALAHHLARDPTPRGFFVFGGLFLPVWWSWSGVTFYNDRFDTDDLPHRVAMLLQMLGAAALAVHVESALEGPGFALSYAAVRAVLVAQYVRVARTVPIARGLALRYAGGFALAAALWAASAFVHGPARFAMWGVAMLIDVGTPLTARALQAKLPLSTSHLPERIGLFTIIVLGEGVAAVVRGAADARLSATSAAAGALGLALAFGVWWVYFENLDERVVRRTRFAGQVWFYGHFPLVMGLAATAVGVERLVAAPPGAPLDPVTRGLLGGSVALVFLSMGVIQLATVEPGGGKHNLPRALFRLGSAIVALAAAWLLAGAGPLVHGVLLAVLGAAQVVMDPPAHKPLSAS